MQIGSYKCVKNDCNVTSSLLIDASDHYDEVHLNIEPTSKQYERMNNVGGVGEEMDHLSPQSSSKTLNRNKSSSSSSSSSAKVILQELCDMWENNKVEFSYAHVIGRKCFVSNCGRQYKKKEELANHLKLAHSIKFYCCPQAVCKASYDNE